MANWKGWVSEQTWRGVAAVKVTRAQIQAEAEKRESAARGAKQATPAVLTHLDKPLEENLNRTDPDIVNASNVEDAIAALRYNSIYFTPFFMSIITLYDNTSINAVVLFLCLFKD